MNGYKLFEYLAKKPVLTKRDRKEVVKYLKKQLAKFNENNDDGEKIAYDITGLLGLDAINSLKDDDPLMEVVYLASILELPPEHRTAEASWQKLSNIIKSL